MTAKPLTEKQLYEAVCRLLGLSGCVVFRLSQSRPTRQSARLPDLCVFRLNRFAWIEVKTPGGKLRPEQELFRDLCVGAGVEHVVGGVKEVLVLLEAWQARAA